MSSVLDIESIKINLAQLDCRSSVSEVHGNLCGLLCGKNDIGLQEWLSLSLLSSNEQAVMARDLLLESITDSFKAFFVATVTALADNNLDFQPLLPDDDSIDLRLDAIAEWAQGFLMGLSQAGVKNFSDYAPEVLEFIEAMAAISTAGDYELAGDESDEAALIEFIEFIRVGVLLLNEELNPVRVPVDIPEAISRSYSDHNSSH